MNEKQIFEFGDLAVAGFGDEIPSLAETDPGLVERFERLAEESETDFVGLMRVVEGIYEGYPASERLKEKVSEQSDQALVEMAQMRNVLGGHLFPREMLARSSEEISSLYDDFGEMLSVFSEVEDPKKRGELEKVLGSFATYYVEAKVDDEAVREVTEIAVGFETEDVYKVGYSVEWAFLGKGLKDAAVFLPYWNELQKSPDDEIGEYQSKSGILGSYFRLHGLDEQKVRGFRENVFPMLEAGELEVKSLEEATNSWGTDYGDYGLSDFLCQCLVSEVNPRNLCELLQAQRELPASDYHRMEQNRLDAIAIQNTAIGERDFIHDERPGIHELLGAMVEFYDAREGEDFAEKTARLQELIAERLESKDGEYYHGLEERALDLENYEILVQRKVSDRDVVQDYDLPVIEILRRLVENTDQQAMIPPVTKDEQLNALMNEMDVWKSARTGEVKVNWAQAGELAGYMNGLLVGMQGQLGMWPSMVGAVAFTERAATLALRGVGNKEWRELPYDEGFKEMVKFWELTMSAEKFSERNFEEFWQSFAEIKMEAGEDALREHYRKLQLRVLGQLNKLAREYNTHAGTAHFTEMLWSGNLSHELIGLADRD